MPRRGKLLDAKGEDSTARRPPFEKWAPHHTDIPQPFFCCRCERRPFIDDMPRLEDLDDAREAVGSLQTGDLLLYQNADLGSVFNTTAMQSSFGHAGVVIELEPSVAAELYPPDYGPFSAPADRRLEWLHVFEAVLGRGVCLFPLEPRLARCIKYNRYLAVRRHEGPISAQQLADCLDFIRLVRGRKLAVAATSPSLVRNVVRLYMPCVPMAPESDGEAFSCGELVVETLIRLGILSKAKGLTSSSIVPTFLTTTDGVPGQLRLGHFLADGHRFRKEQLLIYPRAPYVAHLRAVKDELGRQRQLDRGGSATAGGGIALFQRPRSASVRSMGTIAREIIELA
jgi:hypothetical protein